MADLRAKYDQAIQTAKRLGFQGAATQEGDKLHFKDHNLYILDMYNKSVSD